MRRIQRGIVIVIIALGGLGVTNCASLQSVVEPEPPEASVESVTITALSFEDAELTARIRIENRNPIAVSVAGLTYTVDVEGTRLLSGSVKGGVEIAAKETHTMELPFTVGFAEVKAIFAALGDRNEADYAMNVSVAVNVPVLGRRSVQLEHSATMPVPRLPAVTLTGMTVNAVGLLGADLTMNLQMRNPNAFGITVRRLDYRLSVEQAEWAAGEITSPVELPAAGMATLPVSVRLRFVDIGRGVVSILSGTDTGEYDLIVAGEIVPDHPLLPPTALSVVRNGAIPIGQ
ncbi:MAG: LEA type 2 family protein [Spirochaeta sp.]|jgi:LEA14-like dessication related protein|nr:LEA type 2 family protein [Spirochaeta sp.]